MPVEHLTDEELQSFAEGRSTEKKAAFDHHLQACMYCRQQLEAYRLINKEFSVEPEHEFSTDFEDVVIARIVSTESKRLLIRTYALLTLMVTCIGLAFCILGYQYRTVLSLALHNTWKGFGLSFEILLFAGIILLMSGLLDNVLLHPKRHTR